MSKRKIRVNGKLYESVDEDELETAVRDALEYLDTDDLVDVWNEFCESPDGFDGDHIYGMSQFDEDFDGMSPLEIAETVAEGIDFTTADDYYYYTRNGNLSSTSSPEDGPIEIDWMVSHIVKSKDGLGNEDIIDALEEFPEDGDDGEDW